MQHLVLLFANLRIQIVCDCVCAGYAVRCLTMWLNRKWFPVLFIDFILQEIKCNDILFNYIFTIICSDLLPLISCSIPLWVKFLRFYIYIYKKRLRQILHSGFRQKKSFSVSKRFAVMGEKSDNLLIQGQVNMAVAVEKNQLIYKISSWAIFTEILT